MTELLRLQAVVAESPDRVAGLLLDVRPGGRSPLAVTGALEDDHGDEFAVQQDGSRLTVTVDRAGRSVTVQGEWWYRGVTRVEPDQLGARVVHQIFDIAPGHRWAVRFVSRGPLNAAPAEFAERIATIGRELGVPARVTNQRGTD